jgi:hypothetical protein
LAVASLFAAGGPAVTEASWECLPAGFVTGSATAGAAGRCAAATLWHTLMADASARSSSGRIFGITFVSLSASALAAGWEAGL